MNFEVFPSVSSLESEARLTYKDLTGQFKHVSQNIPVRELSASPNSSIDYVQYVKKQLERQAREDLADQAVQLSQYSTPPTRGEVEMQMAQTTMPTPGHLLDASRLMTNPIFYSKINASASGELNVLYEGAESTWATTVTDTDLAWYNPIALKEEYVEIEVPVGKRSVVVRKKVMHNQKIVITEQDIVKAMQEKIESCKLQIITNRADRRAEELLQNFVSEVDFRNYKEKGYFLVNCGKKLYKIYKDKSKFIDMWELDNKGMYIPKNRLCTHTKTRDLPHADEALSKLMLVRSGSVIEHSNRHSIHDMDKIEEKGLILCPN